MKSRALISIAMTLCALLISLPLAAQEGNNLSSAPREYTLQVLPGPPGLGNFGNANSLNDLGWVTGISDAPDETYEHAVLWRDGQPTDLGTLGGYNSNGPVNNRNNTGWVVGTSETAEIDPYNENFVGFGVGCSSKLLPPPCLPFNQMNQGYLWQSETNRMVALPPLVSPVRQKGGGNNSIGSGANHEEIFGIAENGVRDRKCVAPQVFRFVGVVWSLGADGKPFVSRRLSPIADDTVSGALGINESGDVVGASGTCGPIGFSISAHAVLWKKNGSVIDLGNLGGSTGNVAFAINNLGQVVGDSNLPGDLSTHAFLWSAGSGMQDLGALPGDDQSFVSAINDSGEVVGVSCNSSTGSCRSFHWQSGVMTDISALPAVSRLQGVTANDINSRGEIAIAANDPTIIDPNTGSGLQIAAVLIPAERAPAPIPAHSTRPNADALVSALAGAKPSTSNAATQSCGLLGSHCNGLNPYHSNCCSGNCSNKTNRCCLYPFTHHTCYTNAECCSGGCYNPTGRGGYCL